MSTNESDDHESIDNRTERALTEYMTVLDEGGDIYTVVGENENGAYQVDARKGRCTCPDHEHRNARCKHLRRVAFALGEEAIPSEVDDFEPQLGDHVGGEPITAEPRADEGAVATDGGVIAADTTTDEAQLPSDPDAITVADTGAGLLLFIEAELPGEELAGFADVSDWAAIRDALRARGLGVGATTHLPTFEIDEVPR